MNRLRFQLMLWLAFFWPAVSWAHGGINPKLWPLGLFPFAITSIDWFVPVIPISIAAEALVLWAWARQIGGLGNLWRAALLYIVARTGEVSVMLLFESMTGWKLPSIDNPWLPFVLLFAGLLLAVPGGLILYRRKEPKTGRIVMAVCTATLGGYLAALGYLKAVGIHFSK